MSNWSYSRCSACPNTHRQVFPSGQTDTRIMLVGEGPGHWEDKRGVPFIGQSGQELDQTYLRIAGLERRDIFITNAVQCRCERNGVDVRPSDSLLRACAENHLREEIQVVQPEIIILAGAAACSLIPGIKLDLEHGFPRRATLYGHKCTVVPMYHPALGMHETKNMTVMLEDWERFGRWLKDPSIIECSEKTVVKRYQLIEPGMFWETIEREPEHHDYLPIDTESDEGRLWSIQFSTRPGQSFMILAEHTQLIEEFGQWLGWTYNGVVMHNAAHDLDDLNQVGIRPRKVRDTMQELYHLGNLPQGLKAAVYRVFGYRMVSYDETVTPYSKMALEDWLACALGHVSGIRQIEPHPIGLGCPTCGKKHRTDQSRHIPHESETVLRRIITKLQEPGSEYDAWERPKVDKGIEKPRLLGRDWLPELEATVGRMPRKSIVHVPLAEAIQYGCSDADYTGRLATWLETERERIVKEEWRVA